MSIGSSEITATRARDVVPQLPPMRQYEGVKGGKYYLVDSLPQFNAILELALRQRALTVDTETSGLNWVHAHVCGIVLGFGVNENYYIPIAHKTDEKQLSIFDILPGLRKLFGDYDKTYIFANAKFDLHGLRKLGIEVVGIIHDIVVIAHLLDENADHGVKELSNRYIAPDADKWDKRIDFWRGEEARRRRSEFQTKAKARVADMLIDPVWQHRAAVTFNVAVAQLDARTLKKFCLEEAKKELADHLCARNKKDEVTYDYIPLNEMVPYACADVHYTYLLFKQLISALAGSNDLKKLYINEMHLIRVLLDAEHGGVKVDVDYLVKLGPELQEELDKLKAEIFAAVGYEFNIGSNDQLIEALTKAGVVLTKLSKGTKQAMRAGKDVEPKFSVDKEVLEFLAAKYPFAEKIQEFRRLEKLKGTYVDNIRDLVDNLHFLHCDYNPNVSTGRMSSREPNLQNIPARNKAIRKAFTIPDGSGEWIFVFIDYSQVELRLTADRSGDPTLLSCYPWQGDGKDVHTLTLADVVLGMALDDVNKMKEDKAGHIDKPQRGQSCECQACQYDFYRNIAKRVNFGIIYGAGPETIQKQVSTPTRYVTKDECADYIERYFKKYPGVREWIWHTEAFMKRNGYVQNSFGRYRRLETNKQMQKWQVQRLCRQGVNFLIQGEAADVFKTAAVRVDGIFRKANAKSRLVNFVHDELQFYWHRSELHLLPEVKKAMEDFQYKVPLVAELSYSESDWAHKKALKLAA